MRTIHRTQHGQEMLIAEMEDQHLINTINLLLKRMEAIRKLLNDTDGKQVDRFTKALYNISSLEDIQEQAESEVEYLCETLSAYILEAAIREINVSSQLSAAFGRSEKINTLSMDLLNSNSNSQSIALWKE